MATEGELARSGTGEHAFVERLRARLPPAPPGQTWIGDDAAVLEDGLLLATDALVENVHFDFAWCDAADVGWKSLVVNLSDIAAMGGTPLAAVVALVVPPDRPGIADGMTDGIAAAAGEFGAPLVGGDTSTGPVVTVSVTVLGRCHPKGPVLRRGARVGDTVFVTGPLGAASAALAALRRGEDPTSELAARLRRPTPRLQEGGAAVAAGATAMIDLSDGLITDLRHLCDASGVGVRLDATAVPLAPGAALPDAFGGDDYELCFTASDPARVLARFASAGSAAPVPIGVTTPAEQVMVDPDGREHPLPRGGWEHPVP